MGYYDRLMDGQIGENQCDLGECALGLAPDRYMDLNRDSCAYLMCILG